MNDTITVLVMDRHALPSRPISRMIMRDEFKEIYPKLASNRISYIFKYGIYNKVPKVEALFLKEKYPNTIYFVDAQLKEVTLKGGLDDMKWKEIRNLAFRHNLNDEEAEKQYFNGLNREQINNYILDCRERGIAPATQEEYKKSMEK